jgi:hypothetical protein
MDVFGLLPYTTRGENSATESRETKYTCTAAVQYQPKSRSCGGSCCLMQPYSVKPICALEDDELLSSSAERERTKLRKQKLHFHNLLSLW